MSYNVMASVSAHGFGISAETGIDFTSTASYASSYEKEVEETLEIDLSMPIYIY